VSVSTAFRIILVLVLATVAPAPAHAGPADKVLGRFTKAQGKKALRAVTSTHIEGVATDADGVTGSATIVGTGLDRYRLDVVIGGTTSSECYNGKSAWRLDGGALGTLLGSEAKEVRLHALLTNTRFQDLARHRVGVRLAGNTALDGRPVTALDFMLGDARERVYFDDKTALPLKFERPRASGVRETFVGDYRRVDGILEPFSIRVREGGREIRIVVKRVTHNGPVDETAFLVPASYGAPLPDVGALFAAVVANQEKLEQLSEHYAFRETRVEREDDGKGGSRTKQERVFSVLPVSGRLVRQLLAVDGRALSPDEAEKEQRRVQKEIQEILDAREKRQEREKREREKGREPERDGRITMLTFLRISKVSSLRRESFRSHDVIALDFEPQPGFKPRNLGEQIVSKLVGTIWVDEAARQVVRLEARLLSSVKIGGGLVGSLSPASAFVLEQVKVSDDLWLPSYSEVNLAAKIFLFANVKQNSVSRFDDYRRYDVDSEYAAGQPTPE
jgi:hypothetical protein